jgi:hypothetical protein
MEAMVRRGRSAMRRRRSLVRGRVESLGFKICLLKIPPVPLGALPRRNPVFSVTAVLACPPLGGSGLGCELLGMTSKKLKIPPHFAHEPALGRAMTVSSPEQFA